ncbi:hypothetical protein B0H13DRAFT_2343806 [Mycena leptocephala]|nr:hypothetical protein B0H13DRAFT_2343806 [Mycena leptocephala]
MRLPHASNAYPRTLVRLIFSVRPFSGSLCFLGIPAQSLPERESVDVCLAVSYSGGITSARAADPERYARRRRRSSFSHPPH